MTTVVNQPVVSVVMPTFHQASLIGKAIESALKQTLTDIELIIVDNYSDDGTDRVVASFSDPRVIYHRFRNDGIIAKSRNYGICLAKGRYIAFLDSDDYWEDTKLEKQLAYFSDQGVVAVASRARLFGEEVFYRDMNYPVSPEGCQDCPYESILSSNPIVTSSMVVDRAFLIKTDLFSENPGYVCFEDWYLWLRLAKLGKIKILDEKLVHYRVMRKRGKADGRIAENMALLIESERKAGYLDSAAYDEPQNNVYMKAARNYLLYDTRKSRQFYWLAVRRSRRMATLLKGACGLLITFLPSVVQGWMLHVLYRMDHFYARLRQRSV